MATGCAHAAYMVRIAVREVRWCVNKNGSTAGDHTMMVFYYTIVVLFICTLVLAQPDVEDLSPQALCAHVDRESASLNPCSTEYPPLCYRSRHCEAPRNQNFDSSELRGNCFLPASSGQPICGYYTTQGGNMSFEMLLLC